jgi:Pectate lyase superfamily protein
MMPRAVASKGWRFNQFQTKHRDEDLGMARFFPWLLDGSCGPCALFKGANSGRRFRNRMVPDALSLEVRICPSALSPASRSDHIADVSRATHDERALTPPVEQIRRPLATASIALARKAPKPPKALKPPKAPPLFYVSPGVKSGPKSLAKAVKSAKPGETIVLAPGTYTQNVVISQQSNITIVGAANHSSILAPASGDAIKVVSSSNITIENVWFDSRGSQGRGLAVVGSSVNVVNIKTDGTRGDGVVAAGYLGQAAILNATSSQFDAVQTGDGLDLQNGASAIINDSTFNGVGTAPGVSQASNGLVLTGNATANISNSQFNDNTNSGLVAADNAQIVAQNCVFSGNKLGDGALFFGQVSATFLNNTFASNGKVFGATTGLNGIEFNPAFTGTAVVSGNLFPGNTGFGLYVGSAPSTIQIVNNVFNDNFVGLALYAEGTSVNANVEGNTFEVSAGAPTNFEGLFAAGSGVTATVGGPGTQGNIFNGFGDHLFIYQTNGIPNPVLGWPNLNILANTYERAGAPVSPSDAIQPS